jgi:hypothetical protein
MATGGRIGGGPGVGDDGRGAARGGGVTAPGARRRARCLRSGGDAWRKRIAPGDVVAVRVADDRGLGFEPRADAARFLAALRDRLQPFGLELHAENTRLLECRPHAMANRKPRGGGQPDTFDVLGFTPMGARHRKTGDWIVRRTTSRQRMVAKRHARHRQRRQCRHEPSATTGPWLGSVVQGSCNDHAVPGNMRTLGTVRRRVIRLWRRQLCLRRQKTRLHWRRFKVLMHRWIPTQRLLPPLPRVRCDARHPR